MFHVAFITNLPAGRKGAGEVFGVTQGAGVIVKMAEAEGRPRHARAAGWGSSPF